MSNIATPGCTVVLGKTIAVLASGDLVIAYAQES